MAEARDLVIIITGAVTVLVFVLYAIIAVLLFKSVSQLIKSVHEITENVQTVAQYARASRNLIYAGAFARGFIQGLGALRNIFRRKRR